MTFRGAALKTHLHGLGLENPVETTRVLRSHRIDSRNLRDVTDDQLREMFPEIGTFNRMSAFVKLLRQVRRGLMRSLAEIM